MPQTVLMIKPPSRRPRRGNAGRSRLLSRLPVVATLALVLTAHAWLLSSVPTRDGARGAPDSPPDRVATARVAPVLQTRTVTLAPAPAPMPAPTPAPAAEPLAPAPQVAAPQAAVASPNPAVARTPSPLPPHMPTATLRQVPAAAVLTAPIDRPIPPAAAEPVATAAQAPDLLAPAASSPGPAEPSAAVAPSTEGADVPTHRTLMPPAARLTYELRRGVARGTGELVWAPADAAYTLSLQGRALGMLLIGWDSQGGFDAAGIAPQRYVDSRRGRDAQAANFRRDSGRITFSGPATELPLAPGTQDRLSWMVQLPAIIAAEPARFEPGAHIAMWVVGARGDMGVWSFAVEARETITVPAGSVTGALHLKREPRKPYDTLVEVWLDPARHHLPAKVRMSIPQTGDMTEFSLQDARFP